MKKGIKFSLWILGIGAALFTVGLALTHILRLFNLMFRAWVNITFFVIMILLGMVLAAGILYTLGKVFSLPQEQPKKRIAQKAMSAFGIVITLLGVGVFGLVIFFEAVFGYESEQVVEKYGQKMVAYEDHWHDTRVTYYEYKNFLVCGYKVLGRELYGTGFYTYEFYDTQGNLIARSEDGQSTSQNDESEQQNVEAKEKPELNVLDIRVEENRKNELVFTISIDDFISSYNSFYWQDNNGPYLLPSSEWDCFTYDSAIHSDHETYYYRFYEHEKSWSIPTVSVYVPTNSAYIQEIALGFDDHGYTEPLYNLYEEFCFYTLKVLFPDFEDDKIIELYSTLIQLAYDNIVPHEQGYSSNSIPRALYHQNGIGLYPYFAIGESLYICIIPIDNQYIDELASKGVEIYNIDDEF